MNNSKQPAYPHQRTDGTTNINWKHHGLTKREHFAAMAMQGLCSCPIPGTHNQAANVSKEAVRQADALLMELAK